MSPSASGRCSSRRKTSEAGTCPSIVYPPTCAVWHDSRSSGDGRHPLHHSQVLNLLDLNLESRRPSYGRPNCRSIHTKGFSTLSSWAGLRQPHGRTVPARQGGSTRLPISSSPFLSQHISEICTSRFPMILAVRRNSTLAVSRSRIPIMALLRHENRGKDEQHYQMPPLGRIPAGLRGSAASATICSNSLKLPAVAVFLRTVARLCKFDYCMW